MDAPDTMAEEPRSAAYWHDQINLATKTEREWRECASKLVKRYRDEKRESGSKVNVFWANTEILKPSVYSQTPTPDVRRRNMREDPVTQAIGRSVAAVLEKSLSYVIDDQRFDQAMEAVRDDVLIVGRGVPRIAYEADIIKVKAAVGIDENGDLLEEEIEQKADERIMARYVFWADFRMQPARCWDDVDWVAFRHALTRDELEERFGEEKGRDIPLALKSDGAPTEQPDQMAEPESREGRAEVWEIWHRPKRERLWVATGHDKVIRIDPDPLGLRDFFPMPEPVYAVRTTDTMVPRPEFALYQDQADELDCIQERLTSLNELLRAILFVDGDVPEFQKLASAADGTMIPLTDSRQLAADLDKRLWWWPVERLVQVIQTLTFRAEAVKQQIYEVTGLSDLTRGATKERETAKAQALKGQYGVVRMTPRSQPMERMVRDLLRIMAEIMAEMFDPATLERMSGEAVDETMMALLRDEKIRNTSIDVATDSTLRPDVQAEKQEAVEFVGAMTQYLTAAMPIAQAAPPMIPLLMEMLKAAAKPFKFGSRVEATMTQVADQLSAQAAAQAAMAAAMPPQPMAPNGAGQPQPGAVQ